MDAAAACTKFFGAELIRVLLDGAADLLAVALARERRFYATLLARRQEEGMPFDILDDVLLLHFALETAQSAFERLAVADSNFCQAMFTPLSARQQFAGCR